MTLPRRSVLAAMLLLAVASLLPALRAQDAQRRRGFSVSITAPEDDALVFGKTRIAATVQAERPEAVDRVEFFVGDELVFVDREPPYEYQHEFGEEPRSYVVRAVAHHREGFTVSDAVVTRRIVIGSSAEVNRVLLWVTVTDREDKLVTDLQAGDFRIFEDDRPQQILEFTREERPIVLAILLDTSGSMKDHLKEVHSAAGAFVDTLRPEDRALVVDFNDNVFLIQPLTAEHEALKHAISSTTAIGGTAIHDALHAAFRRLRGIEGRKAIVILSDGQDTMSEVPEKRIVEEARTHGILIYGVGLGGGAPMLRQLSDVTGGRYFSVGKATDLGDVYERIAAEIRSQYFISYSTENTNWDGRWIEVRVEPVKREHQVRHRKGFYAIRSSAGVGGDAGP